jgi:hypothetical protein
MRTTKEVKVIQVDQTCSACHKGVMRPTGQMLASHPPQYPHECNMCGHRTTYLSTFPSLEYHPVEAEVVEMPKLEWKKAVVYLTVLPTLLVLLTDLWYNGERSVFAMLYKLPITIVSLFVG